MPAHPVLADRLHPQLPGLEGDAPVHRGQQVVRRQHFELKDGGAGQDRVEDGEVGVLRGGGDEGDLAVLDELQQGLLLLLVEILDLVQVEQHAVGGQQGAHLLHHVPDVRQGGGGGVEPPQGSARLLGDDVGHGGFSGAGGAVEHHVGDLSAVDDPAEQAVLPQNVALAQHLVQGLRADAVRQRLVHTRSLLPLCALDYSILYRCSQEGGALSVRHAGEQRLTFPGPCDILTKLPKGGTAP